MLIKKHYLFGTRTTMKRIQQLWGTVLGRNISNVVILLLTYFLQKASLRLTDDLSLKLQEHILQLPYIPSPPLNIISTHHLRKDDWEVIIKAIQYKRLKGFFWFKENDNLFHFQLSQYKTDGPETAFLF